MARSIGLVAFASRSAVEVTAMSRAALDFPLHGEAVLAISRVVDHATVLGAFQRETTFSAPSGEATLLRRGSGGPAVRVGPGTLHVLLALATPDALTACDAPRLLNRYVRPILRALNKLGAPALYGGRDFLAVAHRPAAAVAFMHDARTGRAAVEAFIAVREPFADPRPSFLGKEPGTLEAIVGRVLDEERLAHAIEDAALAMYDAAFAPATLHAPVPAPAPAPALDPPWSACVDEAIGPVCAGRDRAGALRVGGDFMAARDAIAALEAAIADSASRGADLAPAIDALASPSAALLGVRSLASFHDVITRALADLTG